MTGVLIWKGEETQIDTQEENQVMTETGLRCLQTKEHQGLPTFTRSWEGILKQTPPQNKEQTKPTETLNLDF